MGLLEDLEKSSVWAAANLNFTGYHADGSLESLKEIDRFIEELNKPGGALSGAAGQILFALAGYVGNCIIDAYGGSWVTDDEDPEGELNVAVKLDTGVEIKPVLRLLNRMKLGEEYSIYGFAVALGV